MGSVFAAEARLAVAKREARRRALMFIIVASVGYGNGMRGLQAGGRCVQGLQASSVIL